MYVYVCEYTQLLIDILLECLSPNDSVHEVIKPRKNDEEGAHVANNHVPFLALVSMAV